MESLIIQEDGTVSLGDGRVLHTVAATRIQADLSGPLEFWLCTRPSPRHIDEALYIHRTDWRTAMQRLYGGETVGMRGRAEGRRPHGVETASTVWLVCAL